MGLSTRNAGHFTVQVKLRVAVALDGKLPSTMPLPVRFATVYVAEGQMEALLPVHVTTAVPGQVSPAVSGVSWMTAPVTAAPLFSTRNM